MKEGGEVSYFEPRTQARHQATIIGIPGAGPSNRKLLDLRYRKDGEDTEIEAVPHEADVDTEAGSEKGFWLLPGERKRKKQEEVEPEMTTTTPAVRQEPSRSTRGKASST